MHRVISLLDFLKRAIGRFAGSLSHTAVLLFYPSVVHHCAVARSLQWTNNSLHTERGGRDLLPGVFFSPVALGRATR